jgi:hypothetical protein
MKGTEWVCQSSRSFLVLAILVRGNLVCSMTQYYQDVNFLKAHPAVRLDDMIT